MYWIVWNCESLNMDEKYKVKTKKKQKRQTQKMLLGKLWEIQIVQIWTLKIVEINPKISSTRLPPLFSQKNIYRSSLLKTKNKAFHKQISMKILDM